MIIAGAGGFAKELIQVLEDLNEKTTIFLYDDYTVDLSDLIFEKFQTLSKKVEVEEVFLNHSKNYVLGTGLPKLRQEMDIKFKDCGGVLTSVVSPTAHLGNYEVVIGKGSTILSGAIISNDVQIGTGCLIYYNAVITHGCRIGNFVEVSPGVNLLGHVSIGDFCQLGAGCTILPNISLGKNVVVGAGAVVTKNFPDNVIIAGVPAVILKS